MTVGVPEIHLDTWGLKYVKKKAKESPFGGGISQGKEDAGVQASGRISDADLATPDAFRSRQEDSKGDKDIKVVGHAGREGGHTVETAQQVHSPTITDERTGKEKPSGKFGVGSASPAGSTQGSNKTPRLTRGGKVSPKPQNPEAVASGSDASHESGIASGETRTGKDLKGKPTDPEKKTRPAKRGTPSGSKRGDAIPKNAAVLDLAIIKCKLLKMKNITKKGEWDHLPHAQKEKEQEENDNKDKEKSEHKCVSCGQKVPDKETKKGLGGTAQEPTEPQADDGTREGKMVSDKEIKDKKLDHIYRSDDIVDKAIELINEAYDEMKSSSFKKLKPVYEGDTKEAKKEWDGKHRGGKNFDDDKDTQEELQDSKKEGGDGSATTSTVGAANFVYSDVEEKKKQEEAKKGAELVESGFVNPDDPKGKLQKKKPNKVQTDNRVVYD